MLKKANSAEPEDRFPDFQPRNDMNNPLYLYRQGYLTTLYRHFGSSEHTIVISETPLAWNHSQREGVLIPDLLIAFEVDAEDVIARRGYAVSQQAKPPDFVLEVASESTGRRDEEAKRTGYQSYGVQEYWRYDPSGGRFHRQHLAGDVLVDGAYQSIPIHRSDSTHFWGHSQALNLDLCWENDYLRWWDPVAQHYLETHNEEAEGRIAERNARIAERDARIAERDARIIAEAETDAARNRIRELEEELRRHRSE